MASSCTYLYYLNDPVLYQPTCHDVPIEDNMKTDSQTEIRDTKVRGIAMLRLLPFLFFFFGSTAGQDEARVSCAPEGPITTSECKVPTWQSWAVPFQKANSSDQQIRHAVANGPQYPTQMSLGAFSPLIGATLSHPSSTTSAPQLSDWKGNQLTGRYQDFF